jgi:hypothetical protein
MEPASSSDDDSSVEEAAPSRNLIPRNNNDGSSSAPSSSSDEDDNDNDDDDDSSVEQATNFNDLPSDDSCMEDSDNDNDDWNSNKDQDQEEQQHAPEDIPLADRIYSKRNDGIKSQAKARAEKKNQAIILAQKRLLELKRKREQMSSDSDSDSDGSDEGELSGGGSAVTDKKKKSKHAPTVASSSRKAFFERGAPDLNSSGLGVAVGANKYKPRDPRMQSLSGYLDNNVFEKRYDFLEQVQSDEIDKIKVRCKAWKVTGSKGNKLRRKLGMTSDGRIAEDDDEELKRLVQERAARRDAKMRSAAKSAVKKKLRDDVADGKRGAYHLKRREMKELELSARFDQLRKKGGDSAVNKVLAKRRKRKMGKDSGLMPKASGF